MKGGDNSKMRVMITGAAYEIPEKHQFIVDGIPLEEETNDDEYKELVQQYNQQVLQNPRFNY